MDSRVFTQCWKEGWWAIPDKDGVIAQKSGPGSSLKYTQALREELPKFLRRYNVRTIFDAGCGDFLWMKHVPLDGINYLGGDVVAPLIEQLQKENPDKIFLVYDPRWLYLWKREDVAPSMERFIKCFT